MLNDARCEPKPLQRPRPPIMIGGTGERRTLKVVAQWADMWDALFIDPESWRQKHDVLLGHCQGVGRDPSEITRSAHIKTPSDADPMQLAEEAAALLDVGVDVAVFSLRSPFDPGMVQPLADALREL